jgi:hypothetical protein
MPASSSQTCSYNTRISHTPPDREFPKRIYGCGILTGTLLYIFLMTILPQCLSCPDLHGLLQLQIVSLDFGPVGEADVTANLMEAVPCGPILQDPAEIPEDTCGLPFLHIKVPHHAASSDILSQVGINLQEAPDLTERA